MLTHWSYFTYLLIIIRAKTLSFDHVGSRFSFYAGNSSDHDIDGTNWLRLSRIFRATPLLSGGNFLFFTNLKCTDAFHACNVTHDLLVQEEMLVRNSIVAVVKALAFHQMHCVLVSIPDLVSTSNMAWPWVPHAVGSLLLQRVFLPVFLSHHTPVTDLIRFGWICFPANSLEEQGSLSFRLGVVAWSCLERQN